MNDFLVGICANIATTAIGTVLVYLYYRFSKRNKLLSFFGIKNTKKIWILISNIEVLPNGSRGQNGQIYSFKGSAISYKESLAATQLQTVFNYFLLSQNHQSGFLSKLLISDIYAETKISSNNLNFLNEDFSIVSVGTPAYNRISEEIERRYNFFAKMIKIIHRVPIIPEVNDLPTYVGDGGPGTAIALPVSTPIPYKTTASGISLKNESENFQEIEEYEIHLHNGNIYNDVNIGFVQRFYDNNLNKCIFYVAGLDEESTVKSVDYLVTNWVKIHNQYHEPTINFLILLSFDKNNSYSVIYDMGV